jgi:hypothetical protein
MRVAAPSAFILALALAGCLATAAHPDATTGASDPSTPAAGGSGGASGSASGSAGPDGGGGSGGGGGGSDGTDGGTSAPTGGGPVADACTACAGAAAQSTCATPVATCDGDPACRALSDCLQGCAAADTACIDDCYNSFPLRAGYELDDVGNCLCASCSGSCTSECS